MRLPVVLVALFGLCHASPLEERTVPTGAAFCSAVTSLVSKAKATSTASKFCSSYLSISTRTVTAVSTVSSTPTTATVTATSTIVEIGNAPPYTTYLTSTNTAAVTSTSTSTVLTLSTSTIIVPETTTVTVLGCPTVAATKVKRATSSVPKPSALSTYTAAALLSSACRCLSLSTPTQTVSGTTTWSLTSTTTLNVVITSTSTPAPTATSYVFRTTDIPGTTVLASTIETSYTSTNTITVTQTTTLTSLAAAPTFSSFKIRADVIGDPGNAANGYYGAFDSYWSWVSFQASDMSTGTLFTLDSSCHLSVNNGDKYAASNVYGRQGAIVIFSSPANGGLGGSPNTYAPCNVVFDPTVDSNYRLLCRRNGGDQQAVGTDSTRTWYAGGTIDSNSEAAKIIVVPVA